MACFPLMFAGFMLNLGLSKPPGDHERPAIFIIAGVLAVAGIGLIITGAILVNYPKLTSRSQYVHCKRGLIHARGGDSDDFMWTDLEVLKTCANPFNRRDELRGHGGDRVALLVNPFRAKIIRVIQEAQVRSAVPRLIKDLKAGAEIKSGRLGVRADGLVDRNTVIPWERVKALNFSYDQTRTQQLFLSVERYDGANITLNASKELPNI